MFRVRNTQYKRSSATNPYFVLCSQCSCDIAKLDPIQELVQKPTCQGKCSRAPGFLSEVTNSPEPLNSPALSLIGLMRLTTAIVPLRVAELSRGILQFQKCIATHIKVNFAMALLLGGLSAGGFNTGSNFELAGDEPGVDDLSQASSLVRAEHEPIAALLGGTGYRACCGTITGRVPH